MVRVTTYIPKSQCLPFWAYMVRIPDKDVGVSLIGLDSSTHEDRVCATKSEMHKISLIGQIKPCQRRLLADLIRFQSPSRYPASTSIHPPIEPCIFMTSLHQHLIARRK